MHDCVSVIMTAMDFTSGREITSVSSVQVNEIVLRSREATSSQKFGYFLFVFPTRRIVT
jgi:hypothetical protein